MSASPMQVGFGDPVLQSQQVFRRVLDAMSRPGSVVELDRSPQAALGLSPAATAVCLTLLDFETPLWLDEKAAAAGDFFVFHCSVPVVSQRPEAAIAVFGRAEDLGALGEFCLGTDEHPETSTTLIVDVDGLTTGSRVELEGPGIAGRRALQVDGVSDTFWSQVSANHSFFPRGVDLILTSGCCIAALPRSVRIVTEG